MSVYSGHVQWPCTVGLDRGMAWDFSVVMEQSGRRCIEAGTEPFHMLTARHSARSADAARDHVGMLLRLTRWTDTQVAGQFGRSQSSLISCNSTTYSSMIIYTDSWTHVHRQY